MNLGIFVKMYLLTQTIQFYQKHWKNGISRYSSHYCQELTKLLKKLTEDLLQNCSKNIQEIGKESIKCQSLEMDKLEWHGLQS